MGCSLPKRISLLILLSFSVVLPSYTKFVKSLPGFKGRLNFRHYSGYLQASQTHFLHYWFVESQSNTAKDPLLVWMNGGPGCSSLDGLLSELGPFHIRDDGYTVYLNDYSWNKNASVIFLEAPAGVGYSYSTDGNTTTDDDQTSAENYEALKQFFGQFPQFRKNDLYITGESYGGIYVPTLVGRILDGQNKFHMNLKGFAVGNGMLNYETNVDTLVRFAYYHGLVDQKNWELIDTVCCKGCVDNCQFHAQKKEFCLQAVDNITAEAWGSGLNVYDLYRDCYHPSSGALQHSRFLVELMTFAPKRAHAAILESLKAKAARENEGGSPPCLNSTAVTAYLNRQDVRKALHIPANLGAWSVCSEHLTYHTIYRDMSPFFQRALKAKLRILVYNGDTDMACNFMMGQHFAESLRLPLAKAKRPWMTNQQIAGFVTQYPQVDFVTVKGAGHMVPQWRAAPALHMISSFLNGKPY